MSLPVLSDRVGNDGWPNLFAWVFLNAGTVPALQCHPERSREESVATLSAEPKDPYQKLMLPAPAPSRVRAPLQPITLARNGALSNTGTRLSFFERARP